jgi:FAD/FMN-containing dehydrogenase
MLMSTISQDILNTLQTSIRGRVIQPDQPGYDESRQIWNGMIDRKPSVVVRCIGTADVAACVRLARANEIPVCIRGGGHNIAGLAVADNAMMIDLSHMRGAFVDLDAQTVNAQPGATLGDIDRETQLHGLAAVLGFVSNTGATGLTLGGGFGYLTRKYGWTCDNVVSMDMITADGELVHASENENSDLLWGLCGGGGNFGVVTNIEHKLYPVGPEITGGIIAWRGEDAEGVLDVFNSVIAAAPRELTCASLIRKAPPAPWLPEAIHGKQIIGIVACHTGTAEQAENDLAALKNYGSPVGDVVIRRPYTQQQSLLDATQPNGRRYYWKSEYLAGLDADSLAVYRKHGNAIESPHSAAIFFALDGALNELPSDHSPMGSRDTKLVLNLTASWDSPDEDNVHIGWARDAWNDMRQFSTGGTYVNFLNDDDGEDRVRAAYGDSYDRLVDVKTKWDPENIFSNNKNILPRT